MAYALDLSPILTEIQSTISAILPIGLTIFGLLLGVKLIPKIIKSFL